MEFEILCLQFLLFILVQNISSSNSESELQNAKNFKAKIELEHVNDPKDAKELATETLYNAFAKATDNGNSIQVEDLMRRISNGNFKDKESRFHLIRIFELMDKNKDGEITNEEYVSLYAEPTASPAKSLEMMHRLGDYDGDGYITKWEQFMGMMIEEISGKTPLADIWNIATQKQSEMDANKDNLVSIEEFMTFIVYQVQKSIFEQKQEEDSND